MSADINLQTMAMEALNAFPPLDDDRTTASDYGQRILTKTLSQKRKAGREITDDEEQMLRATLDIKINTAEVPSATVWKPKLEKPTAFMSRPPEITALEAVISDCFHTATDGSPEHLRHLRYRAMKHVADYLGGTDAGWFERRRFLSIAKKKVQKHMREIQNNAPE